jgi:nucleoside-diphosphate-sugar epimerase
VQGMLAHGMTVRGTYRQKAPALPGVAWYPVAQLEAQEQWRDLMTNTDVVVHLAALVHEAGLAAKGRWLEYRRVNVDGTLVLARACRQAGVRRFVFVSSIAVYGRAADRVDEHTPTRCEDDYGRSKLEAEDALRAELSGSETDWCILRPPAVYGPGGPGNISRLQALVASGVPLPFGAIRNSRSFISVDNLVDAILTVLRYPRDIQASFVVSDGSDFATPAIVRALAVGSRQRVRLLNVPVPVLRILGRIGDFAGWALGIKSAVDSHAIDSLVGSLVVDCSRFREVFEWRPPIDGARAFELAYGARPGGPAPGR